MANIPPTGTSPIPPLVDNPLAPDIYADLIAGLYEAHGNIRLTLETARVSHIESPGPVTRIVVGRIILPRIGAEALRDMLNTYLDQAKAKPSVPQAQGTPTLQ